MFLKFLPHRKIKHKLKLSKFGGICGYCGLKKAEQLDHIVPKCKGGTYAHNNVMPSCPRCNQFKAAMTVNQFRRHIGAVLNAYSMHTKNEYSNNARIYHILDVYRHFSGQFYFEKNTPHPPISSFVYNDVMTGDIHRQGKTWKHGQFKIYCYDTYIGIVNNVGLIKLRYILKYFMSKFIRI